MMATATKTVRIDTGGELVDVKNVPFVGCLHLDVEHFLSLSVVAQRLYICLRNEEGVVVDKDRLVPRDSLMPLLDTYMGQVSRACRTLVHRYDLSYEQTSAATQELVGAHLIEING